MRSKLRLFPLNAVLFPGAALNLHVFEPRYKQLIGECIDSGDLFGIVLIREGAEVGESNLRPYEIGCGAEILEATKLPFGRYYVSTKGRQRFRIREVLAREPYLTVDAEFLTDADPGESAAELNTQVHDAFAEYLELLIEFSGDDVPIVLPDDAVGASYAVADALQVTDEVKQHLLELDDAAERLELELHFLRRLVPQLRGLLQERATERARRKTAVPDELRSQQERYFGKYFSPN